MISIYDIGYDKKAVYIEVEKEDVKPFQHFLNLHGYFWNGFEGGMYDNNVVALIHLYTNSKEMTYLSRDFWRYRNENTWNNIPIIRCGSIKEYIEYINPDHTNGLLEGIL